MHERLDNGVVQTITALGLRGRAFDPVAIAADYEARMAMDASLDDLVGPTDAEADDTGPAPAFDAWNPG